jgi:hypothetical protein
MSLRSAAILVVGVLASLYVIPRIWQIFKSIPAYQCPRCYSYNVAVSGTSEEEFLRCDELR